MGELEKKALVIAGGGPAGLTAAIYAARAGLDSLLIERGAPGGQMFMTDRIENYPGFPNGVSGAELSDLMRDQAVRLGAKIIQDDIQKVELVGFQKKLHLGSGDVITCEALIAAPGSRPRLLGAPGEMELMGRGVSYCATCDGNFFRDQRVAVVGGGDSAVQEAAYLTRLASKVFVIHRRDQFRAADCLARHAQSLPNLSVVWDSVVEKIEGSEGVEALKLLNLKTNQTSRLEVEGVFIFVGVKPLTDFLQGVVELNPEGYILAGEDTRTSAPGLFAAGDARVKLARQIATAVGDGAAAVKAVELYFIEKGLSCRYA